MKINLAMTWRSKLQSVGTLEVFRGRSTENYQFVYADTWIKDGFQIDPMLPLIKGFVHHTQTLPGVLQDSSPDRWGRLILKRAHTRYLYESDYLLGVSDSMRMGALRLALAEAPERYLAEHQEVPQLIALRDIETASHNLESGSFEERDLQRLMGSGSSLGGAHPKAVVKDEQTLYLAKFQSLADAERVTLWEATLLDLAGLAKIPVPPHRILDAHSISPILLIQRFDRFGEERIPFMSAMTLMGAHDGDEMSYVELAALINTASSQPQADSLDMWTRMTFNALTGNTDDHLRNHGFLRRSEGWRLAPVYDLNPEPLPYTQQAHALSFQPGENIPSVALCLECGRYFNLSMAQCKERLSLLLASLRQWRQLAHHNGLVESEIERMANAFEHQRLEEAERMISKTLS